MYNKADIMFMYAETSVHVGGGESVGAIDLAIAREKYTDFPYIPSSGVKGAIRDWFEKHQDNSLSDKELVKTIFGAEDGSEGAGAAVFSDARILLFPVRSLKGVFGWITSPMVLHRLNRDMVMAGKPAFKLELPSISPGKVLIPENSACRVSGDNVSGKVVLEEFTFEARSDNAAITQIGSLLAHGIPDSDEYRYWQEKLKTNLILLSDDDFADFVKTSTEIQTRIKIDSNTKTVSQGALFYQENLPADSIMYTITGAQKIGNMEADAVMSKLYSLNESRVQLGGNESVGKGIYCMKFLNGGSNETNN